MWFTPSSNPLRIPVGMHGSALLLHRESFSSCQLLQFSQSRMTRRFWDCSDRRFATQLDQKGRIVVAASLEEACSLLKTARPRLIVVHLTGESGQYEQFDRLLWATSVVSRPTPVVVIAERYRIDQATMMYRMGVSEYISRTHHLDQLGRRPGGLPSPGDAASRKRLER